MNDLFTHAEQEHFEERAAIIEYDGGESREKAEAAAAQEVLWERDRFRSMVRQIIRWKLNGEGRTAIAWLEKQKNGERYAEAARKQMALGNVGAHPDWRE